MAVSVEAHLAGMRATRVGDRASVVRAAMESVVLSHGMEMAYAPIVTTHGELLHAEGYATELRAPEISSSRTWALKPPRDGPRT